MKKIENIGLIAATAALILIFMYFILGLAGLMTALAIMLLFMLPVYLILDNFDFEQDEKIIFSLFASIGVFPSIAYWLGMLISFKIAIITTFALLLGAAYLLRFFKKGVSRRTQQ